MTGTVREYLYAGGEAPTAMRARQSDGSYKNYFFVTNTHGDVVAVTDRDGQIVSRYAYGPWGEATRVSETVHQPFRFAGYRYEDGFDIYYLRARWYDAGTGRFLSRDSDQGSPRNLGSMNRYSYASCSPPTLVDPSGRRPCDSQVTITTDLEIGLRVAILHKDLVRSQRLAFGPGGAGAPPASMIGAIIWLEQLPRTLEGEVNDIVSGIIKGAGNSSYGLTNITPQTARDYGLYFPPGSYPDSDFSDPINAIIGTGAILNGLRAEQTGYRGVPWNALSDNDIEWIGTRYNRGRARDVTDYGKAACQFMKALRDRFHYD